MAKKKAKLAKHVIEEVFADDKVWTVKYGELKRGKGKAR